MHNVIYYCSTYFCEVRVSQFDERHRGEGSLRVHDERAFAQSEEVGHDYQEVRGLLYWKETASRYIDTCK